MPHAEMSPAAAAPVAPAAPSPSSEQTIHHTMKTTETPELNRLLVDQLKDIYWAEKKLTTTLPKLAKKAQGAELKAAFEAHLTETQDHLIRLEEMFNHLGLQPRAKKCDAMQGLIDEGDALAGEYIESPALDAALIAAAQKVEHYEIATYGTLRAFAKNLGLDEIVRLITLTIEEEGAADKKLTRIAETKSNRTAERPAVAA
jgi:ferritin-like metal-binding protein YciE